MPDGSTHNPEADTKQGNVHVLLGMPAHLSNLQTLELLATDERLNPTFRDACRREVTRAHAHRRQHEAGSGVCWSGMGSDPYAVRSVDEIEAEAKAEEARRASPRGRLLSALRGVDQLPGYEEQAWKVRGIFDRDLSDDRKPADQAAVAFAIILLNAIPGKDARAAIEALAEMLLQPQERAA